LRIKRFKRKTVSIATTLLAIAVTILLFDRVFFPLPTEKLFKQSSVFVYSRDGELLRCFLSVDDYWRKPVKISGISPLLKESVITCEDRQFYYHPGFNPISLIGAAIDNLKSNKVVRGGSTLTMQIARMMEPKPRTVKSKIIEIIRAVQLEVHFTKDELLELYFNLAPYGGNIEGVGAASFFYFGKEPSELTASQAALLTSIPNSPNRLRPDTEYENSIAKRNRVLRIMYDAEVISADDYDAALEENIERQKYQPPFLAPHHTVELANEFRDQTTVRSTIDLDIQNFTEGIIQNNISRLKSQGIHNVSIVVIDNQSAEIMAIVGSADFFNITHQGQVNGTLASRSPGSALKPFAYSLAIENGLISPNMILSDLPVYYAGYSPENYDEKYRGAVSAKEALKLSLNVPAVELCSKVGLRNFYDLLKKGGMTSIDKKYYEYGLPLVLGACEVKLIDLANLYYTLARGGVYRELKTTLDAPEGDTLRILSNETSYIIAEMLTELKRPDFPSCWEFSPNIPKVAWKTGTSYGRKDAWAIGFNKRYTVGVWVGNFNGDSSPNLVGAEAAAPILFEIFQSLANRSDFEWFDSPADIGIRYVCATSGMIPGGHCHEKISEFYIPGVSPSSKCIIHKQFFVDTETGFRVCNYCAHGKKTDTAVYENWPPKMSTWLLKSGMSISQLPEHNPDCTGASFGDRPIIISPMEGITYIYRDHIPADQQGILLDASVASGTDKVYWFLNGKLYGKISPGSKMFLTPCRGKHNLTCSDDRGRSTTIKIEIL
jgi:penicillin-binding protein 1C